MAGALITKYLESPPYLGRSLYKDKDFVKATAGFTCCFDDTKRMWGTRQVDCLVRLVQSGKFQPFGIEEPWNDQFLEAAQEFAAAAERKFLAQEEEKRRLQASTPKPAPMPAPQPSKKYEKTHSLKRKPGPSAAPASAPTQAPKAAKTQEPVASQTTGVEPTEAEVAECARLGFTADAIAHSDCCDELGPRGTLSNEGRILRWCLVLRTGVRHHLHHGVDKHDPFYGDLVTAPFGNEAYFDLDRVAKLSDAASQRFATRLAKRCRGEEVSAQELGG